MTAITISLSAFSIAGEKDTPPKAMPVEWPPFPVVLAAVSHSPTAIPHRRVQVFRSSGSDVASHRRPSYPVLVVPLPAGSVFIVTAAPSGRPLTHTANSYAECDACG